MKRLAGYWMLLACAGWSGCAGTETGNPSFEGKLGYDAYSSRPGQVGLRSSAITRVESAWLVLGEVEFATRETCEREAESDAHAPGLGAGDHVATQAPPTQFTLGEDRYCEVRLAFERASSPPDGAPDELAGHSILIRGSLPDDRRFEVASTYRGEVALRSAAKGFAFDAEQPSVVIGFDVATWLGEVVWPSSGGDIRVDADNNPAILLGFEARLAGGITLFRDANDDGMLDFDPEELARGRD